MKKSYFPRSHLFHSRTDFLVNFSKPSSLDRLIIQCIIDKVLEKNITYMDRTDVDPRILELRNLTNLFYF